MLTTASTVCYAGLTRHYLCMLTIQVALYDVATGGLLTALAGHYKPVRSLCFTPGRWQATSHRPVASHIPWKSIWPIMSTVLSPVVRRVAYDYSLM